MSLDEGPLEDRVERERLAHTERDVLAENRRLKRRFPHIESYPSRKRCYEAMDRRVADIAGKRVLDLGCGEGERSLAYLARGATVLGIDISDKYVARAREAARQAGYGEDRGRFRVMDAHRLEVEDETLDVVIGYGVLHHLNWELALAELNRVLAPGGRALFQEPLADNPLLRLFRTLTPRARTADEAPFARADLERIAGFAGWRVELSYCGIVSAPLAMLTSVILRRYPDNAALRLADRLERALNGRGILPSWNQYVFFDLAKI